MKTIKIIVLMLLAQGMSPAATAQEDEHLCALPNWLLTPPNSSSTRGT